ncbi:MAG: leucine-rich repeat protein [Tidjanibacter sp.]|nr:leucine-rich repeat protein [Tidjanibacter sp.]
MKLQARILILLTAAIAFVGCDAPKSPVDGSLSGIKGESNKIYYTSQSNVIVNPVGAEDWGVSITENTNIDGVGCICFSGDVTIIPEGAFEMNSDLTSILLPSTLVTIGERAFMNCARLTEITIPDSVISIGASAFTGCVALQSVSLGNGLRSIGDNAFAACQSLLAIDIPEGIEEIGKNAIPANTSYTLPSEFIITYRTTDSQIIPISEFSSWAESLGVDYIVSHTFKNGEGKIVFNKRLTQVGFNYVESYTSYGDTLLEVTIPESVTIITSSAFANCYYLQKINFPTGLTEIGYAAFYGCHSLTEATIPQGVKEIEGYAFEGCSSLTKLTIENGVEVIRERAFEGCTKLGTVVIPESVTNIEQYAFANNILENIVMPEKFYLHYTATEQLYLNASYNYTGSSTYLIRHNFTDGKGSACFNAPIAKFGNHFLSGRKALTGVTIPESVTMIGERALYECPNITEITIPEGVTKIGKWAFENCTSLSKVTLISPVPPTVGSSDDIFKNTSANLQIIVPKGSEEAYRTAQGWSTYSNRITSK